MGQGLGKTGDGKPGKIGKIGTVGPLKKPALQRLRLVFRLKTKPIFLFV
jgi:hypothetical protein